MFFLKKWFKKDNYLITTLKKDHLNLLNIFNELKEISQENDFEKIQSQIKLFVNEYYKHILLEDTQLYQALKEKYQNEPHIAQSIINLEKEMNKITRAIKFFDRKYSNGLNKNNKDIYLEELNHIGNILKERIDLEEERLYPLFK